MAAPSQKKLAKKWLESLDEEPLSELVERWLRWDMNMETRAEITKLRDSGNTEELEKRLRNRIQFGTAGLRGKMAAGFSCMNELTVIQTSQGLAKYLKEKHSGIAQNGVVIGWDARHNSVRFSILAANAFIAEDIPVYWYAKHAATPLVAYGVSHWKAAAGVMITASHNPAQDNGYKVYFHNGAQINTPMDVEISQYIEKNLVPWPGAWDEFEDLDPMYREAYLRRDAYWDIVTCYTSAIQRYARSTVSEWRIPTPFMYTPLHGVGRNYIPFLCHSSGIHHFHFVAKQTDPDGDFPTVTFPNPEEPGSLDLAMIAADECSETMILANDPDADRFAVAEKVNGSWFTFTGNQIGVLLASHIFDSIKSDERKKSAVLTSAVSTGMLEKMAIANGIHFEETLTGFKWMGNIAKKYDEEGPYVVRFAFEEALGYMFPEVCYDKDGLTAAMVFLAAEAKWKALGLTPYAKLQQLYNEYGHHETLNNYLRSPSPALTNALFNGIRKGSFFKEKKLGAFKILRWRDMTEGYDSGTADNKPTLPVDKKIQMLTLWLDRDVRFTIRGSGTEPKVKLYIESCSASREEAVSAVCDTFSAVLKEWVRPFAPKMTYSPQMTTSSGHIFKPCEP
ncbi:hypothetical protein VTN02DRAFT_4475 [Thermoascus thermophilus]